MGIFNIHIYDIHIRINLEVGLLSHS